VFTALANLCLISEEHRQCCLKNGCIPPVEAVLNHPDYNDPDARKEGELCLKILNTWTPSSTTTIINGELIIGSSINQTINTGDFDGAGTLEVQGSLTHSSGTLTMDPTLTVSGTGTGTLNQSGGTINLNNVVTNTFANLNLTGGTLTGTGDITVTSAMTFDNSAIGGNRRLSGSAELLFPMPGTGLDRSIGRLPTKTIWHSSR